MSLQSDVLLGVQVPQILVRPDGATSREEAQEAIELAEAYGICRGNPLDASQQFTLEVGLGTRADGTWAARTMADFEPRQNGKNDSCAARELHGLVNIGEQLILHTAHEAKTVNESFERFVAVLESWDDLRSKVKKIRFANGEKSVEMFTGGRLLYMTRTGSAGRGFAEADLVIYDEAQHLMAEQLASSAPTKLANPNSQSWYMGSGGLAHSAAAWRLRKRALRGDKGRFGYVEHTAEVVSLVGGKVHSIKPDDIMDRHAWARANAAYGHRITDENFLELYEELGPELFARECLNLWDMEAGVDGAVWEPEVWAAAVRADAEPVGPYFVGVDQSEDKRHCAIAIAGGGVVELLEPRPARNDLHEVVIALATQWGAVVAYDPSGPANWIKPKIEAAGVKTLEVSGRAMGQACSAMDADVNARSVAVRRHPDLEAAVRSAVKKPQGDVWVWDRRDGSVDVSPLVAVTLAWWAAAQAQPVEGDHFAIVL